MKDFSMPKVEDLLLGLTESTLFVLLNEALERRGMKIKDITVNQVDSDPIYWGSINGWQVELEDGRIFTPRPFEVLQEGQKTNTVYRYAEKGKDGKYNFNYLAEKLQ